MERNEYGDVRPPVLPQEEFRGEPVQLAMVYAPDQAFRLLYTPQDALTRGTLFEELYKPLENGGACRGRN